MQTHGIRKGIGFDPEGEAVLNGGDWSTGEVAQVQISDNTLTYTNNSEVVVTVVVSSEVVNNVRGTDTLDAEVRLVV